MTTALTHLRPVLFTVMMSGCLAPTIPAEVCKSNVVRKTEVFMETVSSEKDIRDDLAAFRKLDELVGNLVESIDEKDCRKETVKAVERLKVTAQSLHDAVIAYDESGDDSPNRSRAEKEIYRLVGDIGMSFKDIRNS